MGARLVFSRRRVLALTLLLAILLLLPRNQHAADHPIAEQLLESRLIPRQQGGMQFRVNQSVIQHPIQLGAGTLVQFRVAPEALKKIDYVRHVSPCELLFHECRQSDHSRLFETLFAFTPDSPQGLKPRSNATRSAAG